MIDVVPQLSSSETHRSTQLRVLWYFPLDTDTMSLQKIQKSSGVSYQGKLID